MPVSPSAYANAQRELEEYERKQYDKASKKIPVDILPEFNITQVSISLVFTSPR
jgi:hypothetical protein